MTAIAREGVLAASNTNNTFEWLIKAFAQNSASDAHGGQSRLYQLLEASAQNLSVNA